MELSRRVLNVIIQQEIQRKSGLAIQTEEEQLRTQLEALNNQLRAPTQFRGQIFRNFEFSKFYSKGRINELLSSIRMQYEGDMRPVSTQGGQLDQGTLKDIQDHLKVPGILSYKAHIHSMSFLKQSKLRYDFFNVI